MKPPYKTVLIGFGMMGAGFANDPVMAKHFRYASHAQVLADHPLFSWEAVIDPSERALLTARERYNIPICIHEPEELSGLFTPDVAVLATPPEGRTGIIEKIPGLKAIIVEKPLGMTLRDSLAFISKCEQRKIMVQVNFWRRGDELFQYFAKDGLISYVGKPLTVFGLYGNGLKNNGSHMIDFIQMLFGEIIDYKTFSDAIPVMGGVVNDDINMPFTLRLKSGLNVTFHPIPFESYREIGIDIWGDVGRLSIYQEGLGIYLYKKSENRAIENEYEIASDSIEIIKPTCGNALYRLYDNLADAMEKGNELWSTGSSAIVSERIIHDLIIQGKAAVNKKEINTLSNKKVQSL